jgi:hypothetical protein
VVPNLIYLNNLSHPPTPLPLNLLQTALQDSKKWITNSADAKLVGHEKDALFPLATCNAAPLVASGGTDKLLLLWDLRDVEDGLLAKREKDEGRTTTELQSRWACACDSSDVCTAVPGEAITECEGMADIQPVLCCCLATRYLVWHTYLLLAVRHSGCQGPVASKAGKGGWQELQSK